MNDSKISVRYAKALVGAAQEQAVLEAVRSDVNLLLNLIKQVPEMSVLLDSPILSPAHKMSGLKSVLQTSFNPLTMTFIELVVRNKREAHLKLMLLDYDKMVKELQGIKAAEVTTAVEINQTIKQQITAIIQAKFHTQIELSTKVDTEIIGGIIMRVEDQQYDLSIATRLNRIKQQFLI